MIQLSKVLQSKKYDFLNVTFHSPTLKAGLTPFVKNKADELKFLSRLEKFLEFAKAQNFQSLSLLEAANFVDDSQNHQPQANNKQASNENLDIPLQ